VREVFRKIIERVERSFEVDWFSEGEPMIISWEEPDDYPGDVTDFFDRELDCLVSEHFFDMPRNDDTQNSS
jgi:hypothetical protein